MLSKKLKNRLAEVGIYVTSDVDRGDEFEACIEYGDNEDYLSYNGTDEDFIDALEDLAEDEEYFDLEGRDITEIQELVEQLRG